MNSQQTIGRYEVLEELGHGAMGTVYRAKDPAMDRIVALKTIRSEILSGQQGGEFRERFYREARAAGALAHPGIVPVFDVGDHDGMPFLVMEYINGRTLADVSKPGDRLPLERVCEIGQQIAEALGYAHKNGVIHRDIKAANILLTSRESYGIERPKITDFGVAKMASVQITTTGQMLGTPAFMPPEQFSGGPIDGRTDLFALGVILYWMATGEYPFPGENLMTVSYKVMNLEPVPPRKLNPAVPESLDTVILKCLAKNPADRYQTCEELARNLAAVRATGMATSAPRAAAVGVVAAANRVSAATAAAGGDPLATLDRMPAQAVGLPHFDQEPPIVPPTLKTATGTKKENLVLVLVLLALVIALGGLYILQNRTGGSGAPASSVVSPAAPAPAVPAAAAPTPAVPAAAASATAVPPAPPAPATVPPAPTAAAATPAPKPTPAAPAALAAAGAESTASSAAAPGALNFDPTKLNPNENGRLRVDILRVPQNVELMLVMDGKLYIRRDAAEFEKNSDDMYVPPGVHEFRVRARTGALLKISNIVSSDFQSKKRKTLRIELRFPPGLRGTSPTPQEIAAASSVFISLR